MDKRNVVCSYNGIVLRGKKLRMANTRTTWVNSQSSLSLNSRDKNRVRSCLHSCGTVRAKLCYRDRRFGWGVWGGMESLCSDRGEYVLFLADCGYTDVYIYQSSSNCTHKTCTHLLCVNSTSVEKKMRTRNNEPGMLSTHWNNLQAPGA